MTDQQAKKQIFIKTAYCREFTPALFFEVLTCMDIQAPEIVFKQAILETGKFQSKLFIEGNNLFGMKTAKQRKTTAMGEIYDHARYDHWIDSIKDYKLFQEYYEAAGYRLNNYTLFLHCIGYATDQNYINKLKSI